MNNVRRHIDKMFAKYPQTEETQDLKEEVIGNVEAEIEDLQNNGISFEEAFRVSIEKVSSLDELIVGIKFFSVRKIVFDLLQWALIYTVIAWILTIPLSMFGPVRKISWLLFFLILFIGSSYFLLYLIRQSILNGKIRVDLFKIARLKRFVWVVWLGFQLISWGIVTALHFGSDIWFSRGISINGPYEFGMIVINYSLPLITIIIPLVVNKLELYVEQHEDEGSDTSEA